MTIKNSSKNGSGELKKVCGKKFSWRRWTIMVLSCMDMVLSCLAMLILLTVTISSYDSLTTGLKHKLEETDEEAAIILDKRLHMPGYLWTWVVIGSLDLVTGLYVWISLKLFEAAALAGRSVSKALVAARTWQNVTFVLVVMEIVHVAVAIHTDGFTGWFGKEVDMVLARIVVSVIFILSRGIFLFIVSEFMKELKMALVCVRDAEAGAGYKNPGRIFVK